MSAPAGSRTVAGPRVVRFTVEGVAQTKGSAKAFVPFKWAAAAIARARHTGRKIGPRAVITNDNTHARAWQSAIATIARVEFHRRAPFPAGVRVDLAFYLTRPKSLKKGVHYHGTRPDVDKLARCVLDGLTGIAYLDDGQVVELRLHKEYAALDAWPRVEIAIREAPADPGAQAFNFDED